MTSFLPSRHVLVRASRSATALAALTVLLAKPCAAQTDPDELARRHFDSGAAYFEQAEYEASLREFEKSYELSARPAILLNIATIHERTGNLEEAVATLDRYLASRPEGSDTIRIRRNNIQKRLEKEQAATAAAAAAAATAPVAAEPQPQPETAPEPSPEPEPAAPAASGSNPVPAYILFGVAGASAAGAVILGVVANSEYNQKKADGCGTRINCDLSGTQGLAIGSTVLTGAAIAAAAAGVLWLVLDDGDEPAHASLAPTVRVGALPTAAFGTASWRF